MNYWTISEFTKNELAKVDQGQFEDELFVLRHSPAARKLFAKAQFYETVGSDDVTIFGMAMELFEAVDEVARDVAHLHPIAYHRWNPRRKWVPGIGKFWQLAKVLGNETKTNEFGESFVRTIDGWWKV